jgi:hypothetical protein
VGSTIWHVVPGSEHEAGLSASQVLMGMQSIAPVGTIAPPAPLSCNVWMQCSLGLGQPVQSPPQQSFRHAPAAQMNPAAQSVHAAQADPLVPAPASSHEGIVTLFGPSAGTHEGLSAEHPEADW